MAATQVAGFCETCDRDEVKVRLHESDPTYIAWACLGCRFISYEFAP